jgi:hypothetical protein
MFVKLKQFGRVATRHDKLISHSKASSSSPQSSSGRDDPQIVSKTYAAIERDRGRTLTKANARG